MKLFIIYLCDRAVVVSYIQKVVVGTPEDDIVYP
jgi:hypothetical protein